ncbi:MAG TPA: alpha-galactosidase [Anaerolineae bacterium]|nr:alpha-galactosidase [Anaerolineae bacterium]HQI85965.1 alpha-galactosidase [Anaerolineae bacterium]
MNTTCVMPITQPADMAKSRTWTSHWFANAADLPIAFVLDDRVIHGIPAAWNPSRKHRLLDANLIETVFTGQDPHTGLSVRVECLEYRDYPVVEWVAWFTNTGQEATPILRDIRALDGAFSGKAPALYHCNGDFYSAEGYTPQETPFSPGDALTFAPNGGRPCDGAFPYYRIMFADGGLTLAIGWPGQWAASFTGLADGVQVHIGQEKTHLRLLPGESIRTPRMTVLAWTGDATRAVNLWRRWYLAHILPRPDGHPMRPLLAGCGTDDGEEFTAATTENQLRYIEKFVEHGLDLDVWWIDAGWYPCYTPDGEKKWWRTGTWEPDPARFPAGLKAVSEQAAHNGAALLLWFEPERVFAGQKLEQEHPEWLLTLPNENSRLLYVGNPACRQWLTDHVCRLIQENGIKIYRQDHNFPPLEYWRQNEAPDRQGMNENLHVQGYLQFWDDLLARNPGLWIDSCSSGGRRNDLETMRRSVPLHYSDYGYGDHPVKLAFHRTLYEWIPYFKEATLAWDIEGAARFDHHVDRYAYHCGIAPMLFVTLDIRRDDYDFALARTMIAVWRRAADLFLYSDYYPHTPFHRSAQAWVAWQFDCPETGCGLIQGIRLPEAPEETLTVYPQGVQPEASYRFENAETGETQDIEGATLREKGFTLTLPARSGAIWFYRATVS